MGTECKIVLYADMASYMEEGWTYSHDVGDDKVALVRSAEEAFRNRPVRKSNVGASVDLGGEADSLFIVRTPYNPDFVDHLKNEVPYNLRKWNMVDKTWDIQRGGWRKAASSIKKFYGEDVTYSPRAEAALMELMETEVDCPDIFVYATLGVRTDAPEGVIHAATAFLLSCHKFQSADQAQVIPDNIPSLDEIMDAYIRVCAHRNIVYDASLQGMVYAYRASKDAKKAARAARKRQ
jgi:hypothetical protein